MRPFSSLSSSLYGSLPSRSNWDSSASITPSQSHSSQSISIYNIIYMCHFSHYLTLIFEGLVAFLGVQEWFEQGLPFMEIKYIDFSTQSIFNALPIISLAYMCQMTVFPVWNELETPSFGRASPLMCSLSCRSYQKSSTFFTSLSSPSQA